MPDVSALDSWLHDSFLPAFRPDMLAYIINEMLGRLFGMGIFFVLILMQIKRHDFRTLHLIVQDIP